MSQAAGLKSDLAVEWEVIDDQERQIYGSAFASNLFVAVEDFSWLSDEAEINSYQMPRRDISKSLCRMKAQMTWPLALRAVKERFEFGTPYN